MLLILIFTSLSCLTFGGEFNSEKGSKIYNDYKEASTWYEKYLYFEMPEDEFVSLFTKDRLTEDSDAPQIINHKNNSYIVKDSKGTKYRITFDKSFLVKFEIFGWEKIPFITAAYRDYTYSLKGYESKSKPGFYNGMPEEEFLKTFSGSILSGSKNNYYEIIGKDGRKYRVFFSSEGFIFNWYVVDDFR
jgi:hypothetical protein